MRVLVLATLMLSTFGTLPLPAAEPFAGFTDRLVMQCSAYGVTNVFYDQNGRMQSYSYAGKHRKKEAKVCLHDAYAEVLKNQFPHTHPGSANKVTSHPDGTIELSYR